MGAKEELVDSFIETYGDRYEGVLSKDDLRKTMLELSIGQLANFVADSANGFDLADLENKEAEGGLK